LLILKQKQSEYAHIRPSQCNVGRGSAQQNRWADFRRIRLEEKKDVKISAGSELALAIAEQGPQATGANDGN
jgi:hypothetical protein